MRFLLPLFGLTILVACTDASSLRSDQPILPVREYERLIVGRLDADYIGNDGCLTKCHKHDKILRDFAMSVHGEQVDAATGLPLSPPARMSGLRGISPRNANPSLAAISRPPPCPKIS